MSNQYTVYLKLIIKLNLKKDNKPITDRPKRKKRQNQKFIMGDFKISINNQQKK